MSTAFWDKVRRDVAALGQAGDLRAVEALLLRVAGRKDAPPALFQNLGRVLMMRGAQREAAVWLRRAAEANPRNAPGMFELGRCLFGLRDYAGARDAFLATARLLPRDPDSLRLAGRAAIAAGDWASAASSFAALERLVPGDEEALLKGYYACCELRSPEALRLRAILLANPALRGNALIRTVRASSGRLPLRPMPPATPPVMPPATPPAGKTAEGG